MITCSSPTCQTDEWQKQLAEAIREPEELLRELRLPLSLLPAARRASEQFPLRVPRSFVARMEKGNPNDPLLRQVLPLAEELETVAGFVSDPTGDCHAISAPGLLHKYQGRALMITTSACAIHCRYCFRRHFPYEDHQGQAHWPGVIDYLRENPDIHELILSGGDPLSLSTSRLETLTSQLTRLPRLERLRLHSRLPVVLPERIDERLLEWLASLPWQVVMVIHANHAHEIDDFTCQQLLRLHDAGVTLLNQSVLLAGVNDEADALVSLSERLFSCRVMPYYLHALDPVAGAHHFQVSEHCTKALQEQLRARLPGYLVPRLVREIPGANSKLPLNL